MKSASRLFQVSGILFGTAAIAAACDSRMTDDVSDPVQTVRSALIPSQCNPVSVCADALEPDYDFGRWPGGVIHYRFGSSFPGTQKNMTRLAMSDWTRATGGAITFQERAASDVSTSYAPIATIVEGGWSKGFRNCSANGGCNLELDWNRVYHEIHHIIGFPHSWQRNDRDHYVTLYEGPGAGTTYCGNPDWTRWPSGLNDF